MKDQAIQWARVKYANEYKPTTIAAATIAPSSGPLPPPSGPLPTRKKRKVGGLLGLMAMSEAAQSSSIESGNAPPPPVCEMEEYLSRPQLEQTEDFDLLAWWKNYERRFPNIARMAKQVHGAPIASAGVERIFSAAGMFHSDKAKAQDVGLLKALLFASFY